MWRKRKYTICFSLVCGSLFPHGIIVQKVGGVGTGLLGHISTHHSELSPTAYGLTSTRFAIRCILIAERLLLDNIP